MGRNKMLLGAVICMCLVSVFCCGMFVPAAETEDAETFYYGDVDLDGAITANDALQILRHVVDLEQIDGEQALLLANINQDEAITAEDALLVLQTVVQLRDPVAYTAPVSPDATEEATETPTEAATELPFEASGVVWIAGDSIASSHDDSGYVVPISGWGEYLADYVTEDAVVHNEARSGRSSKSYLYTSNYKSIQKEMAAGDFLFIAFGLNDEKVTAENDLYTDPYGDSDTEGSFQWYLKTYYVEPALEVGAMPVLMSPVVRATYNDDGSIMEQSQVPWAEAMEALVEEYAAQGVTVYYIDLYEITMDWYEALGQEGVLALHGVDNEGELDTTHFSEEGARQLAEKIIEEIERQQMELDAFLNVE